MSTDGEQNMQENSCHNSDNGQRWTPQSTIPWWPESLNSAVNPRLRARSKIAKKITWEIKDCEKDYVGDQRLRKFYTFRLFLALTGMMSDTKFSFVL